MVTYLSQQSQKRFWYNTTQVLVPKIWCWLSFNRIEETSGKQDVHTCNTVLKHKDKLHNTCPNCPPWIKIIELIEESNRVPVKNHQSKLESDYICTKKHVKTHHSGSLLSSRIGLCHASIWESQWPFSIFRKNLKKKKIRALK